MLDNRPASSTAREQGPASATRQGRRSGCAKVARCRSGSQCTATWWGRRERLRAMLTPNGGAHADNNVVGGVHDRRRPHKFSEALRDGVENLPPLKAVPRTRARDRGERRRVRANLTRTAAALDLIVRQGSGRLQARREIVRGMESRRRVHRNVALTTSRCGGRAGVWSAAELVDWYESLAAKYRVSTQTAWPKRLDGWKLDRRLGGKVSSWARPVVPNPTRSPGIGPGHPNRSS